MTTLLKSFESRIVRILQIHAKFTRTVALEKIRNITDGNCIDTVHCYNKLFLSLNKKKTINELFGA